MIDNIIVKDIICLGIMVVVVFLSAYSITLIIQQTALAQQNQTSTGSVTAQVVPQGTSLTPSNNATGTSSHANQGSVSVSSKLNCQSIASTIGGIVVPNPSNICDVLILRQAPTIIGPGNMNMNKFSTINSIVEVATISDLMTKQGGNTGGNDIMEGSSSASNNTNSQKVFAMGEFSLLDPQLVTMVKATVGYNWTIAAVHNHMVLEKPKMMFVHWSAEGELNTIINQIKNVLLTVSKVSTGGSSS